MNKQIELLARQAGAAVQPGGELLFFGNTSIEKFAQLIVRECEKNLLASYDREYGLTESVTRMKEYFGVEE
jgi:hypothetical protein